MTQIKLSIAFVLAAAAIAPIVAQPIREAQDFTTGNDLTHHHHERVAIPDQSSTFGHHENKERRFKEKDHRLREVTRKRRTLSGQDNALEDEQRSLRHKNKVLRAENKILGLEAKALGELDVALAKEGQVLAHNDKVLAEEGKALGHRPRGHSKPGIVAREYTESDEIFERANSGVAGANTSPPFSASGTMPRSRIGTVVRPKSYIFPGRGLELPPGSAYKNGGIITKPRFGLALGPEYRHKSYIFPGRGLELPPLGSTFTKGGIISNLKPRFGLALGPEYRHTPKRREPSRGGAMSLRNGMAAMGVLGPREYTDSDDMFERDFEDAEFDARDFDELYLD